MVERDSVFVWVSQSQMDRLQDWVRYPYEYKLKLWCKAYMMLFKIFLSLIFNVFFKAQVVGTQRTRLAYCTKVWRTLSLTMLTIAWSPSQLSERYSGNVCDLKRISCICMVLTSRVKARFVKLVLWNQMLCLICQTVQRDVEVTAEDEQVFLMKQQTQLSKQPTPSPQVSVRLVSPKVSGRLASHCR